MKAGQIGSESPERIITPATIPIGTAPASAPHGGITAGNATPITRPAEMAIPSAWQRVTKSMSGPAKATDPAGPVGGLRPRGPGPLRQDVRDARARRQSPPGRRAATPAPPRRRAHTTSRDLERYAGLFAKRTQVMRSSAMRDLMAITARPEVISLAGGLPDTSTFPPETLRRADDEDRARVLGRGAPVRADRGVRRDQGVHRRGDGRRGDAPGPRRPDRHDGRPAGDRPDLARPCSTPATR